MYDKKLEDGRLYIYDDQEGIIKTSDEDIVVDYFWNLGESFLYISFRQKGQRMWSSSSCGGRLAISCSSRSSDTGADNKPNTNDSLDTDEQVVAKVSKSADTADDLDTATMAYMLIGSLALARTLTFTIRKRKKKEVED